MKNLSRFCFAFLILGAVNLSAERDSFEFEDFIYNIENGEREAVENALDGDPGLLQRLIKECEKSAQQYLVDIIQRGKVKIEDVVFYQSLLRAVQFDVMVNLLINGKIKEFKKVAKELPELFFSQDCFGDWFYDYIEANIENKNITKGIKYLRSVCIIIRKNRSLFEDLYRAIKKGNMQKIDKIFQTNEDLLLQEVKKGRGFDYYIKKGIENNVIPTEEGEFLLGIINEKREQIYNDYGKWIDAGMGIIDTGTDLWDNFAGQELEEKSECLGGFCKILKKIKGLRIRKRK